MTHGFRPVLTIGGRPERMIRRFAVSIASVWGLAFVFLGLRRWACAPPWSSECLSEFGRQSQAAILFLWVRDRETLIGVAAAVAGGILLYRQIRQDRELEQNRVEKRYRAARAVTPLALGEICDWAELMIHCWIEAAARLQQPIIDEVIPESLGGPVKPSVDDIAFPKLDREWVRDTQQMVEASVSDLAAAPYIALLQRLQVQITRARDFPSKLKSPRSVEALVTPYCYSQAAECAEVHARAKALFVTARNTQAPIMTEPALRARLQGPATRSSSRGRGAGRTAASAKPTRVPARRRAG